MSEELCKQVEALQQRYDLASEKDKKRMDTALDQINQAIAEHEQAIAERKKVLYENVKQIIKDM